MLCGVSRAVGGSRVKSNRECVVDCFGCPNYMPGIFQPVISFLSPMSVCCKVFAPTQSIFSLGSLPASPGSSRPRHTVAGRRAPKKHRASVSLDVGRSGVRSLSGGAGGKRIGLPRFGRRSRHVNSILQKGVESVVD